MFCVVLPLLCVHVHKSINIGPCRIRSDTCQSPVCDPRQPYQSAGATERHRRRGRPSTCYEVERNNNSHKKLPPLKPRTLVIYYLNQNGRLSITVRANKSPRSEKYFHHGASKRLMRPSFIKRRAARRTDFLEPGSKVGMQNVFSSRLGRENSSQIPFFFLPQIKWGWGGG